MFTRAVVVADESATPEVSEVVEALRVACDPDCAITELIDAPIRSMLTGIGGALREAAPTDITLLLFCGDIARGLDDQLYFTCVADDPTPMTAVLVDVLIDLITSAQTPVVAVFDCVMEERDEFARDPIRVLERGIAASPANALIADASTEGVGGVARLLADGLLAPEADLDGDGFVTARELFTYIERNAVAVGVPADAIVVSARSADVPVARVGGYDQPSRRALANTVLAADVDLASESTADPATPRASGRERRPYVPSDASSPRKRRVRVVAAVGAITVAALAVFGGIARSISSDDSPVSRTTVSTVQAYTATGTVALPDTCTNVPARLEITVDAAKIPANLTVAAVTRLDNEPGTTSVLERIADPQPGDGLYVAAVGPFAHPGTLSWRLLLNSPVATKNVAMRCGGNLPRVTSTSTAPSTPTTLG